ncbi:hypothetical protein KKF84_03915, partial [Myxococcota bacterium]|nr:hypothetical protein [Myxococcota bacterium]
VSTQFNFAEALSSLEKYKITIIEELGADHRGYVVQDLVISCFQATPRRYYNANNADDAKALNTIDALASKLGDSTMEVPF